MLHRLSPRLSGYRKDQHFHRLLSCLYHSKRLSSYIDTEDPVWYPPQLPSHPQQEMGQQPAMLLLLKTIPCCGHCSA